MAAGADSELPFIARQVSNDTDADGQVGFECERLPAHAMRARALAFHALQNQRRSVRFMSTDSIPEDVLLSCVATAGCAPSGAHQQPWHFSIISSADLKKKIRLAVEAEEQVNYDRRMKQAWLNDLAPIFKNSELHKDGLIEKPYLTDAPYLVVLSELLHGIDPKTGEKK